MFNKKKEGKVVATVECRMRARRLPGKVLMSACGKPMLELQVERLKRVRQLDCIILATTKEESDNPIVELAEKIGIRYFCGSESDVLSRVLAAARSVEADFIVEVTGDCPLLDPEITSQLIDLYLYNECDFASTGDPFSYPIGMDVGVFSTELLALADREGKTNDDREHVSWYFRHQPDRFRKLHLHAPPSLQRPDISLTLDEKEDYKLIRTIFEHLYPVNPVFSCYDIIKFLDENPELLDINAKIVRTEPYDVVLAMQEQIIINQKNK